MKKYIHIIALLFLVPIFLTACTKDGQQKSTTKSQNVENGTSDTPDEEQEYTTNVMELMKMGKNIKCTFDFKNEDSSTKGVTYVSGDKSRSEMEVTTSEGKKIETYTIIKDEKFYTWTSETNEGTIINLKEFENTGETENPDIGEGYKYDDQTKKMDYKCTPWINIDNSKFEVPTNIQFLDYSDLMKQMMEMSEKMNIEQ